LYGAKKMNMISTGAFLTEMDASDIQKNSVVNKLVRAWEQKNSKTARAGGVSLMALSLAACASSNDDTSVSKTIHDAAVKAAKSMAEAEAVKEAAAAKVIADAKEAAAVKAVEDKAKADLAEAKVLADAKEAAAVKAAEEAADTSSDATVLTTAGDEVLTGVGNISGIISSDGTKTTFNAGDEVTSTDGTDTTFTFTDSSGADITAAITGTVRNFDNVVVNIDALAVSGTNQVEIAFTDFSKANTYTIDNVADNTIIADVVMTGVISGGKVTTTDKFSAVKVTPAATGDNVVMDVKNTNSTVTVVNVAGNVEIVTAGKTDVTAATTTGLVSITSAGNITATMTDALSVVAKSTAGSITLTNSDAALLINATATKGVTLTDAGAATDINVVAGGNVSVVSSGAGDVNVLTTGTVTTSGSQNATSGTYSSVGASTLLGDALATATLSGNGAAADYTMSAADHSGLATVSIVGSQDVTLAVVGSEIAGTLSITDSSTAGTFTLDIDTAGGDVDLKGGSILDALNVKADMAANDLTVVSGQTVTVTTDQATASDFFVGAAGAAAANAVTVNLNDGNATSGAVDLNALTISQAKTVNLNTGLDVNVNGDVTNLTSILATASNATLNVDMGANNLTITTAITVGQAGGYGTLDIAGSGTLNHGAIAVTASHLDASDMTGAITGTGAISGTGLVTISSGSAGDTIELGANTITSVNTGGGNDSLTLVSGDYGTKTVQMNGGAGTDTLAFQTNTLFSDTTASSSLTGFQTIQLFATGTAQEIDAKFLDDAVINVKASATGANSTVTIKNLDADTDLSSLIESVDVASTTAAMTFVLDASARSAATVVTGMTGAKNTITGSTGAGDTLTGGGKADSFVVTSDGLLFDASNVMLDTIAGGVGTDTLTVGTSGTAFTIVAADNFSKASAVENITAVANSAAVSITLGATAETAGIVKVDISSAGASPANTVNAAAYTSAGMTVVGSAAADTITTSAGSDVVTGGAGADTISTGLGNDTLNYALTADLFSSLAKVDTSVSGGGGTDTIKVGTTGTAFAIAANDVWTGISTVEKITANANTSAVSISLDGTAHTAGIRTVDISAGSAASSNVISAVEFTGVYNAAVTLTGSATGANALTGGAGADAITGGTAIDTIIGGAGADTINVGADDVADTVQLDTEATIDTITNFKSGTGGDQFVFDVSALNGGNIAGSNGAIVTDANATGLLSYTVGVASAANAVTTNVIKVTNTTGIDSITDVNTALGNDNITMAGGTTGFANAEASLIVFYDANDAKAVVGYLEDSAAASAGVFDGTGSTFVQLAEAAMSTTDYTNIVATNFDII
jgi:hypothetical protein